MTLCDKIQKIYPTLSIDEFGPMGSIRIENHGEGDFIASWNNQTYQQPTQDQLDGVTE